MSEHRIRADDRHDEPDDALRGDADEPEPGTGDEGEQADDWPR
jgi:hypothetical protein